MAIESLIFDQPTKTIEKLSVLTKEVPGGWEQIWFPCQPGLRERNFHGHSTNHPKEFANTEHIKPLHAWRTAQMPGFKAEDKQEGHHVEHSHKDWFRWSLDAV